VNTPPRRAGRYTALLTKLEEIMKQDERIRIELTDEQKKQVKEVSGRDVTTLEFTAQELEARIAPATYK
jgi:hypothetical protein